MTAPSSPGGYQPLLPKDADLPAVKIDVGHPRWKAATEAAHRAGLTQEQFSHLLAHEVRNTFTAQQQQQQVQPAPAAPQPQPAPAAKIEGYANMTMAQKLAAAGHL